jgi:two-component system phosphate regulon sensor histidine kinase PhoR
VADFGRRLFRSYRARLVLGYALVAAVLAAAWLWSLSVPMEDARRYSVVLLLVALGVSLAAALALSAAFVAPVRRLARSARRMADGDLGARVPEAGGELEDLSDALSDLQVVMRARLEELENDQRILRKTLNGLEDAVFLIDGETVRLANEAADRIFGEPSGGWRGRLLAQTTIPPALVERILQDASSSEPRTVDWGPDVDQRFLTVTTMRLRRSDPSAGTLVVAADVTERMRLDRVRRDFVSNASHELKTPAAGIQLLAESLETAAEDGDLEQALHFASQLKTETARLRQLVQDLLDLSRIESLPPSDTVTDVRRAIGLALTAHGPAARKRGLELREDISMVEGEDVLALADPTDVAIALDNLLSNAVGYTEEGGVTVRLSASEADVLLEIEDTGIGIPAEDLPRVFERFYRVDRSRSRERGGTGLGLALVRHVIEKSGGTIELSSVVDEGTAVRLTLPRAA